MSLCHKSPQCKSFVRVGAICRRCKNCIGQSDKAKYRQLCYVHRIKGLTTIAICNAKRPKPRVRRKKAAGVKRKKVAKKAKKQISYIQSVTKNRIRADKKMAAKKIKRVKAAKKKADANIQRAIKIEPVVKGIIVRP